MADSLARYYKGQENYEEALAHLILGYIYKTSGDYSTALDYYLRANKISEHLDKLLLRVWINRGQGDLYFEQGMHEECIDCYKESYSAALQKNDTLRIALASYSMARVFMIKNNVDSILFYLKQSFNLASRLSRTDCHDMTKAAKSTLADIYIQIEEYDKAKLLMTRNKQDDYNWAYWHLAQHHTDSAYWYFSHIIKNKPWNIKVEYLPILAKIEEEWGNRGHSLTLYKELAAAKDSMQAHSQVEATRKVKELYAYNLVRQERDNAERKSQRNSLFLGILVLLVLLGITIVCYLWRRYQEQKERELAQERLLRQEEERKGRQSAEQIVKNQQQIILLRQQLEEAKVNNDAIRSEMLLSETRLLDTENERIQARLQHERLMQDELERSPLRERIKQNAGKEHFHLSDKEWQQLSMLIDNAYDQFTARLRNLYDGITEYELHIC